MGLFQEMHEDSLNGCDEKVDEWEEIELLVDSGASVTVVKTDQIKAVKASDPDPKKIYVMADGNVIYNKGEKLFRAASDEYRTFQNTTQVADVDKAVLSVAQVVGKGVEWSLSRREFTLRPLMATEMSSRTIWSTREACTL